MSTLTDGAAQRMTVELPRLLAQLREELQPVIKTQGKLLLEKK